MSGVERERPDLDAIEQSLTEFKDRRYSHEFVTMCLAVHVPSLVAEVRALGVEREELREALRAVLPWIPTGTVAAQRARSLLDRAAVPVPGPPKDDAT